MNTGQRNGLFEEAKQAPAIRSSVFLLEVDWRSDVFKKRLAICTAHVADIAYLIVVL